MACPIKLKFWRKIGVDEASKMVDFGEVIIGGVAPSCALKIAGQWGVFFVSQEWLVRLT